MKPHVVCEKKWKDGEAKEAKQYIISENQGKKMVSHIQIEPPVRWVMVLSEAVTSFGCEVSMSRLLYWGYDTLGRCFEEWVVQSGIVCMGVVQKNGTCVYGGDGWWVEVVDADDRS